MKFSAFLVATAASSAIASPLVKRVLETVIETETVFTTVTHDPNAPSTTSEPVVSTEDAISINAFTEASEPELAAPILPIRPTEAPVEKPAVPVLPVEAPIEKPVASVVIAAPEEIPSPENSPTPEPTPLPETTPAPETTSVPETTPVPKSTPAAEPEPVTSSNSPSTPRISNTGGSGNSFIETSLKHHNIHRANHSSPEISWDEEIAGYAAITAATCNFAHDTATGGGGYGQNIAMWASSTDVRSLGEDKFIGRSITEMWYNGEVNLFPESSYGKATPDMSGFHDWGHYTQIVWAKTTGVGCHVQYCPPGTMSPSMGAYYSVCNYSPAGNVGGAYAENVKRPAGQSTFNAA